MMPRFFLFVAWPLRDLCELLCKISDNGAKRDLHKDAKITKIQSRQATRLSSPKSFDRAHAEVLALLPSKTSLVSGSRLRRLKTASTASKGSHFFAVQPAKKRSPLCE